MGDKKGFSELVKTAALSICGVPPKNITLDDCRKIYKRLQRKMARERVNFYLRELGYKRVFPVSQNKKVLVLIATTFRAAQKLGSAKELLALKEKLTADISKVLKEFRQDTPEWDTICSIARRRELPGWPHAKEIAKEDAKTDEQAVREKLIEFLSRARTNREIETKFGKEGLSELSKLAEVLPKGFRLKKGRNAYQEDTVYLEQIIYPREIKVQKRVFELRVSENDPDYLAIIFPPEMDFVRDNKENDKHAIRILPLDEVRWGDFLCDQERFKEYLNYIDAKPYVFAFFNGNIIGGSGYTKDDAAQIREEFKRLIAPVAHKILWAQSGPLEAKMQRVDGVEPFQAVCRELGIHHADRPVHADVYWKHPTKPVEFAAYHGRSQARNPGAKANAIVAIIINENFPHFCVLGHLKDGHTYTMTARRLSPVQFRIVEHSAHAIICPGFLKHQGSEEEKKGYPSPATGTVACVICADNRHEASS